MTTSVLWVSRHSPLPGQRDELSRLFGEVSLTVAPEGSVSETLARFEALPEPRELVLVAPLAICREVLKRGVKPLCPMMKRVKLDGINSWDAVLPNGRAVFTGYKRRTSIHETFEEIIPNGEQRQ